MTDTQVKKMLRVDNSACHGDSMTRRRGDEVQRRLSRMHPGAAVTVRNLSRDIGFLNESRVQAKLTNPVERSQAQHEQLADSERLVCELEAADVMLVTAPVYARGSNANTAASENTALDMLAQWLPLESVPAVA